MKTSRPIAGIMLSKEGGAVHPGFVHEYARDEKQLVLAYSYEQDGVLWSGTYKGQQKTGSSPPQYNGEWNDKGTDEWTGTAIVTALTVPDTKHVVLIGDWQGHPKGKGTGGKVGSWLLEVSEG